MALASSIKKNLIFRNSAWNTSKISISSVVPSRNFAIINPTLNHLQIKNQVLFVKKRTFATPPQKAVPGQGIVGKYAFHLKELTKRLPDQRILFEDVNTSVFYGYHFPFCTITCSAKIGIIGINGFIHLSTVLILKKGSGKSSLLKIIAGEDTEYDGTFYSTCILITR